MQRPAIQLTTEIGALLPGDNGEHPFAFAAMEAANMPWRSSPSTCHDMPPAEKGVIMKKKPLVCLLSMVMALSVAACGSNPTSDTGSQPQSSATNDTTTDNSEPALPKVTVSSLDELNTEVTEYVDSAIADLQTQYDALTASIGDYNAYVENIGNVQQFYASALSDTETMCLQMYQYALDYVTFITSSDRSFSDQYDDMEELYDVVYDEEGTRIYDDIYDGIMSDAYDYFYDGVVSSGYDLVPYDEWSDYSSDEYDLWSDTRSDIYDIWSDTRSDIYDFYSDVRSDIYAKETKDLEKDITRFQEDLSDLQEELLSE
ncbi:hypothetical protein [uncultured Bifidobacterium sp.]|uniref:hypothetical protein n=1 Tax=uncultured Bifidobacterium sp. TaxID=165187 RepID=UPI002597B396|nr:hypothetical protein [uncultured Bifidobacterium sp.]